MTAALRAAPCQRGPTVTVLYPAALPIAARVELLADALAA